MIRRLKITILAALLTASQIVLSETPGTEAWAQSQNQASKSLDKIPCLRWFDESTEPRAVLFCIHGLGLHKGTYEDLGKTMAKQGIVTYAIDMRGFGAWIPKGKNDKIDFDGSLVDIKRSLTEIRRLHPGLPIIVLGESMGGGIGIHATALYPDLIDGLISSVPAGDRFNSVDNSLKIGVHAIFGGFNKPIDIGPMVVDAATKKNDLREKWLHDPLCRTLISPNELISFQHFMNDNFECAGAIKTTPVLFIFGCKDKLVRPAGTVKLFDSLSTPNKDQVLAVTSEHLIFEEGQFKPNDIKFVTDWIDHKVLHKDDNQPDEQLASNTANQSPKQQQEQAPELAPAVSVKPTNTSAPKIAVVPATKAGLSYWIELNRGGKIYRCNNKMAFKSGDSIRFHLIPQADGYAYVLMKQGSSGKKTLLFPSNLTGTNNYLKAGTDYPLPYRDWLTFDQNPGIEKVSLLYSTKKIADETALCPPEHLTAFVSQDRDGAKDLVPTRMQLSWDDPTPVVLPDQIQAQQTVATAGSTVKVTFSDAAGLMAVDVALAHQ